ncbi:MAG: 4Fe-4S dicluster domain-containing protein [Deltaproteobacteria bacterium]|nr:4Fe-4S dicluster domain-containing protein [Deltaproteobacteria bacterium]
MEDREEIVLEAGVRHDFIDELQNVPGGERVRDCIQCGTCSGSCPVSFFMDNTPRKLLAMIRAGMRDQVLESNSLWFCTSCYMCTLRCPRQIAVTDIIYALKRTAIREGRTGGAAKAAALASAFTDVVDRRGRNYEPELLTRYYLKTNPAAMLGKTGLGIRLFMRGRFPLSGERIRGIDEIRAIIAKANEIGGL